MSARFILPALLLSLPVSALLAAEAETPEKNIFVAIYNDDMDAFTEILSDDPSAVIAQRFGKSEDTPLHRATLRASFDMVGELVLAGADVNSKNKSGFTPLHYAVTTNSLDCIRFLLRSKAEVNAAGAAGWTPLHLAARFGFADAAKLLLDAKANTSALANGKTPADLALEGGFSDLATLLKPAGAPAKPAAPVAQAKPAPAPAKPVAPAPAPEEETLTHPEETETLELVKSYTPNENLIRRRKNFDGSVFEGEMTNKKPNGFGTLKTMEGHVYEGFWKNGERSGNGVFTYANGNRYTGAWSNDVPHGEGHFSFANGGHVDGTWKDGILWSGSGVIVNEKTSLTYKCIWEDGECTSQREITPAASK